MGDGLVQACYSATDALGLVHYAKNVGLLIIGSWLICRRYSVFHVPILLIPMAVVGNVAGSFAQHGAYYVGASGGTFALMGMGAYAVSHRHPKKVLIVVVVTLIHQFYTAKIGAFTAHYVGFWVGLTYAVVFEWAKMNATTTELLPELLSERPFYGES